MGDGIQLTYRIGTNQIKRVGCRARQVGAPIGLLTPFDRVACYSIRSLASQEHKRCNIEEK